MSRRGNTGMHSGNDAPGDLAGRPTAAPDPYEPGPYAYTCDPADPVLAERYARRRRAAVAGLLAAVVLGGTGYAQAVPEVMGLRGSGALFHHVVDVRRSPAVRSPRRARGYLLPQAGGGSCHGRCHGRPPAGSADSDFPPLM